MRVNPVLRTLGAYPMASLQDTARAMRASGEPLIDFSIGDPREPTPAFIRQALIDGVPEVSQYPQTAGLPELREAIAAYVGRRFDVAVDPDRHVIPVSGSKEAIFSTPLAFVDRSRADAVIWPTPGYPIYERGALFAGARPAPVRLGGDFVLRADDVPPDDWRDAALCWVNYPHNPTGAVIDPDDLRSLVEKAREHDVLLCSDECYVDLYEEGDEPPTSVLRFADDDLAGVLSYLSLSKRSGMTGYRSGAIVGDPVAIDLLRKLRSATGTASPEFVQRAAIAAWSDDAHVAERRRIFAAKRAVLRAGFEEIGVEVVGSRAGLYLWVRVGDDVAATEALLRAGVVVAPGRAFGPGGEGFLRLALVPTVEECRQAVPILQERLRGIVAADLEGSR